MSVPASSLELGVPRRRCGSSDLTLPILGMGCWAYGGGEYWGAQSQRDVDEVVRHAVEHGCNFFDTAEAYNAGASESALGAALAGLPRESVIVCTKISPSNCAPADVVAHCEASLRRLRTDYLDLYMVHWPITAHSIRHFSATAPTPSTEEAFAALDRLRRAGKVRHFGVSNFGPAQLAEVLALGVPIAVNELPYSLLTRAVEREILPLCQARGIGVLGYMALLQGVLADRYLRLDDLPPVRRRTRHFDARKNPLARGARRDPRGGAARGDDHLGARPEMGVRQPGRHQLALRLAQCRGPAGQHPRRAAAARARARRGAESGHAAAARGARARLRLLRASRS